MKIKKLTIVALIVLTSINIISAQSGKLEPLFTDDLSNANYTSGVWTVDDGVITASEDQAIWTKKDYDNFMLDLEFKKAEGTNSGVIVYCSNTENWIPNSVEIQIADDFARSGLTLIKPGSVQQFLGIWQPAKAVLKSLGNGII